MRSAPSCGEPGAPVRVGALTNAQVRTVGEYGAIELGDELYFARAFSTGKGVAASLALAQALGADKVLCDLVALRQSMLGSGTQGVQTL